jgi:hypothetical protein
MWIRNRLVNAKKAFSRVGFESFGFNHLSANKALRIRNLTIVYGVTMMHKTSHGQPNSGDDK